MLSKDTIELAERVREALKYLYIHLGEAQGVMEMSKECCDDWEKTLYMSNIVKRELCQDLIDILENAPKNTTPSAHSSSTTYRLADDLCTPTMTERSKYGD